jgi:hypothetical protein
MTLQQRLSAGKRLLELPELEDGNDNVHGCLKKQPQSRSQQLDVVAPKVLLGEDDEDRRISPASAGSSCDTDPGLSWLVSCGFDIEFDSDSTDNSNSNVNSKVGKAQSQPQVRGHGDDPIIAAPPISGSGKLLLQPLRRSQLLRNTSGLSSERSGSVVTFATKLDTLHFWADDDCNNHEHHDQDECASVDSSFADVRSASGEDTYFSQSFVAAHLGGGTSSGGTFASFNTFAEEDEHESEEEEECECDEEQCKHTTLAPASPATVAFYAKQDDCRREMDTTTTQRIIDSERRTKNLSSQHSYFSGVDANADETSDSNNTCCDGDGVEDDTFATCRASVLTVLQVPEVPSASLSTAASARQKPPVVCDSPRENDDFLLPFHEVDHGHEHGQHGRACDNDNEDEDDIYSETTFLNGVSFDEGEVEAEAEASFSDVYASTYGTASSSLHQPPVDLLAPPRGILQFPPESLFRCLFCPAWK